ncbi:fibrous sheath CABYR-binding protein-like [Melanaphis sacchari]|uniref:fibrous sheath CABYR-binding protein-like n=1 Tax=Melanaphis sacchari TaxID=742174 RepID=UPI000DC1408E|nr:fibrous sheath CABYR-binding protein-like [Melanaphis sacchari]
MVYFKAIVLVSVIVCLISAEKKSLKERIFNCKLLPFKKHHSIFNGAIPSIESSLPIDFAVPINYAVSTEVTTHDTELLPTPSPAVSQQQVQYPPQQEVQYPSQPEIQYPPQPEVQYPEPQQQGQPPVVSQQEVQNPPQQEVQNPPQQEVQNPPQQQPLYPPQHEGQRPAQYLVAQNSPSYEGLYPPQHTGQYYPSPNYQDTTYYNVPYNYPVYGQNVLRSVKSVDGQTYTTYQHPYKMNMFIRHPNPYYNAAHTYGLYDAPAQYDYIPQKHTPKALVKST